MTDNKILLFYPQLNESIEERDYHWFPFSVLPLAASLAHAGYEPLIVDRRVKHYFPEDLSDYLDNVLFVGISAMSGYQVQDGLRIARKIRKYRPDLPIIWGGWHPTILPEETANHPFADIAITGRGEETIVDLANAITNKNNIDHIPGVAYKNNGTVTFTGYQKHLPLKDDAQQYDKFIDIELYINPNTKYLGYFSGHGCSFNCAFCSRHFMTNRYSPIPTDKVIKDIQYFVSKYGFKHIHFQDDNFFLDKKRALKIAEEIIRSDMRISWWANVRADIFPKLSEDEIKLLFASGLNWLFIGAESGSQELLDTVNKKIKSDDILKASKVLKDYEITIDVSYIFGLPGDNIEKLKLSINQIAELKIINSKVRIQTCFYQPYPGTPLYKKALEWGYPKVIGLDEWGMVKPQSDLSRIPWLSDNEMGQYENIFNNFFKRGLK